MSLGEWRGGLPAVFRGEGLTTTPVLIEFGSHLRKMDPEAQTGRYSPGPIKYLMVRNHDSTNNLKLYFFESHATNDEHYVLIKGGGQGENTFQAPVEAERCWVAADEGTLEAYEVIGFMRRP